MAIGIVVLALALTSQQPEIIDRTLAIVSGRTITLSDARTAMALGLVEGARVDAGVVQRLIDRELMLREADRYQPPEPSLAQLDEGVAAATRHAGGEAAVARLLAAGGFSPQRLRNWVRDDLRVSAYLQQRFPADERRPDQIADWVSDLRRRAQITVMEP
jgi:hypothetical protein